MYSVEEKDPAKKYFDPSITDRERAIFEGGIALAMLYHQFVGIPVSIETASLIEKAMEKACLTQPFRKKVEVRITPEIKGEGPYGYSTLKGKMIDARVTIEYGKAEAIVRMRYIPELNYTLMYVEKVSEKKLS